MNSSGLTLIELLVGMVLTMIILSAIASLTASANQDSLLVTSRAEMLKDAQVAQQLITGRLSEAIYVEFGNTNITINNRGQAISNVTNTNNTTSGSQTWRAAIDPIVVMITPPADPSVACSSTSLRGCYNYYAYLTSTREFLQSQNNDPEISPVPDPLNQDSWIILQYHAYMVGWEPSSAYKANVSNGIASNTLPNQTQLSQYSSAMILLEYVQPQSDSDASTQLFPDVSGSAANKPHFFRVIPPTGSNSTSVNTNDGQVIIRFRMQKRVRGLNNPIVVDGAPDPAVTTTAAPSGISYIGGTVSPRNWWQ